jgi:glucose-6-phosphate-specific signal transduction histidine kinase
VPKPNEQNERELESRVTARTEELSALSTQLLKIMEGERSELARHLHDELGGLITAAKMDMSWLAARIGATLDAQSAEKFNSVVQMLNQAMILKRRVVESLRPSLLDHFGLGVAIRSHFDEECKRAGIECISTLPEEALELESTVQLTLFRVAQEVLVGIIARGGAQNVELVIEPMGEGYVMTVGDDGGPMDTNLSRAMASARHRVALAGGSIEAEARTGGGSSGNQVRVFVPRSAAGSA